MMDCRRLVLALVSASLLVACGDVEDGDLDSTSAALFDPDFTGVNGLSPADEWAARPDSVILLGETFKQSPTTRSMYDTASGKYTLAKLAQCGLPDKQSVRITNSSGVSNWFTGHFGLIPGWTSGSPTSTQARWLWGCVGALLNAYGTAVRVSMRGNNAAYHPGTLERQQYTFEEAVWTGDGEKIYAFIGRDLYTLCGVASVAQLEKRVCARATPTSPGCPNVTIVGRAEAMCSTRSGNHYSGCKVGTKIFNEMTTSMLETTTITTCENYAP
jgi:hypothetical protein